jgi:glycosyltransferase involved in cell wall biosynthesis
MIVVMDPSAEQQLIAALTQAATIGPFARRYETIESLIAELVGGQQEDGRKDAIRGPDIVVRGVDAPLVAIELKVFSAERFEKSISNRAAELIATSVETRRSFRGDVTLSSVLLLTDSANSQRDLDEVAPRMAHRLLRAEDGVGYDSVLFGSADTRLHWRYFASASSANETESVWPASTTEALELVRSQKASAPTTPVTDRNAERQQRILLVADEWQSGRGGLSTVNRELATSLAAAGVDVAVLVPTTSDEDVRAASEANVSLVTPARVPGLSDREALLLRPVFGKQSWEADVVIGHGRLLGPYAAAQQQQFFPNARRVHFVHTDAEQLEAAKEEPGGASRMAAADARRILERDLAQSADLVVGIGPLLTETIRDELIGARPQTKVIGLMPGLRATFDIATSRPPVKNRVLIVGRADDFHSKGIDIAAEAMLKVVDNWEESRPHKPTLVIRGVPDEAATEVKERLDRILEGRVTYHLRPFSDSEAEVTKDLAQARVLLMPSRHEGFGLAAYEAIASGVPVLISAQSGLAQFLRESEIDTSPSSIVTTCDSSKRLAIDQWADAIQNVLDQTETVRAQAIELRRAINERVSWQESVSTLLSELNSSL